MKSPDNEKARQLLTSGTLGLLVGILLCAVDKAAFGSWICLVSAVLAAVGLHRFGRLGPDQPHLP